ncbi:MAG: hypothetical protein R2932_19960 [Caldilineaceae bacterium]
MLQNRAFSSSVTPAVSTDLADSLERTLANERLRVVKRTLSLPDSLQSFLVFVLMLVLTCAVVMAHLLLSTDIHAGELRLNELKATNLAIERETTVLLEQIAVESSLDKGMARAKALGYEVAYERRYIVEPTLVQQVSEPPVADISAP